MWNFKTELIGSKIIHFYIDDNDGSVSYETYLELLQNSPKFREVFIQVLSEIPFEAFRWETRPLTGDNASQAFECVVIDSPELIVAPDIKPFKDKFLAAGSDDVLTFNNLSGESTLIVPSQVRKGVDFSHLAKFVENAPRELQHKMWIQVGRMLMSLINESPVWLSTAGSGVAWLHIRIDQEPKYYRHFTFKHAY